MKQVNVSNPANSQNFSKQSAEAASQDVSAQAAKSEPVTLDQFQVALGVLINPPQTIAELTNKVAEVSALRVATANRISDLIQILRPQKRFAGQKVLEEKIVPIPSHEKKILRLEKQNLKNKLVEFNQLHGNLIASIDTIVLRETDHSKIDGLRKKAASELYMRKHFSQIKNRLAKAFSVFGNTEEGRAQILQVVKMLEEGFDSQGLESLLAIIKMADVETSILTTGLKRFTDQFLSEIAGELSSLDTAPSNSKGRYFTPELVKELSKSKILLSKKQLMAKTKKK